MQVQIEREIYIRASRSFTVLCEAIQCFKGYLEPQVAASAPEYYRARNLLKEGKAFYDQTLQDAKKLLGPIPIYAAKDFEKWRSQVLIENKIIVQGQTLEELRLELYEKVNALGIGAQGLGGLTTILDVKIATYPTHAASKPVAMIPKRA